SPSASSSASMRRPTVGWVSPSLRAAPDRLPSRTTSKKVRNSSQEGSRFAIRKCIAGQGQYAIPKELSSAYVCLRRSPAPAPSMKESSMAAILDLDAGYPATSGFASGSARAILRLEGAAAFAASAALYAHAGYSWPLFAVLLL